MSLEVVRHALLDEKKRQIQLSTVARSRGLLALFRAAFRPGSFGASLSAPLGPDEQQFLNDNDISQSKYFNEISIPAQSLSGITSAAPADSLQANGAQDDGVPSTSSGIPARPDAAPTEPPRTATEPVVRGIIPNSGLPQDQTQDGLSKDRLSDTNARVSSVNFSDAGPPVHASIDGSISSSSAKQDSGMTLAHKIPDASQGVAQGTLKASTTSASQELYSENNNVVQGSFADVTSSPSSTAGAHSTFTPRGLNHSPDTSPDIKPHTSAVTDTPFAESKDVAFRKSGDDAANEFDPAVSRDKISNHDTSASKSDLDDHLRLVEEEAAEARERPRVPKDSELTKHAEEVYKEAQVSGQVHVDQDSKSEAAGKALRADTNLRTAQSPVGEKVVKGSGAESAFAGTTASHSTTPTERMATRVSTGAMRHRSVTELLGSRPSLSRQPTEAAAIIDSPLTSTPITPVRKELSRPSTALITKHDMVKTFRPFRDMSEDYAALRDASTDESKDYLTPLFFYQASQPPKTKHSLQELVMTAHKTLSTSSFQAVSREFQEYRILRRIYQLQFANRWSLRQMEIAQEKPVTKSHLDYLLEEMKWMRTDFREERKLKTVIARNLANWCRSWVLSSAEGRKTMQVAVKNNGRPESSTNSANDEASQLPDLIPSSLTETDSEAWSEDFSPPKSASGPSALFALDFNKVQFELDQSPLVDALLQRVPAYSPVLSLPVPIAHRQIIPVSKLASAKLIYTSPGLLRKRSRFEYEEDDNNGSAIEYPCKRREDEGLYSLTPSRRSPKLEMAPEKTDLALFSYENKHVRDRLHAIHAFRPPSEFGMPSTSFFESRSSSQWHWDEDQELRGLVKEYSYNWSLIASCLAKSALYTSAAERRTPWECFERWVQLDGLPPEMSKTQYFRTYQARLEAAAHTVNAAFIAQQQQAVVTPNQAVIGPRRRTTQPFRVEKRKSTKYLTMLDLFRKNAKKREITLHKSQENAKAAQLRRTQEAPQQKPTMHSPAELSRLRFERDQKMAEKMEENRQRYILAQKNAALQRQANSQLQNAAAAQMNANAQRNGVPAGVQAQLQQMSHVPANMQASQMQSAVQLRLPQNMNINSAQNTAVMARMANLQGAPTPQQMQAIMASQQRINSASPEQQMQFLMQQQQQQHAAQMQQMQLNQPGGLANAHLMGATSVNPVNNPTFMAAMAKQMNMNQGMNGTAAGSATAGNSTMNNGNGPLTSPRLAHDHGRGQPLSSGHVPAINQLAAQIRRSNPNLTVEQVQRLAASQLIQSTTKNNQFANARQHALNAAAGNSTMTNGGNAMNMGMNVGIANMGLSGMPMGFPGGAPAVNGSPSMANVGMAMGISGHGQGSVSPVQNQNYSRQMALQQQQQQAMQRQMAGSPAVGLNMNGSMGVSSRSATPQQNHQRAGSQNAMEAGPSPNANGRPSSVQSHQATPVNNTGRSR